MPIFNSLGSNYSLQFVLKALFTVGNKKDSDNLKKILEERYGGEAVLFYKGRQALTYALNILNLPKDSLIVTNGFTCVAVFNAIRKAGFEPLCLDLEDTGGLNFTAKSLEIALKSNKNVKVVTVQNTFGYPCDIKKIQDLCKKNNLILIEDLAHCVGTKYENGKEAGTVGDFVILSFSQDKVIDAVSGGALVIRNIKIANTKSLGAILRHPEGVNRVKDRIYPLETYKICFLYNLGLGKLYHFLLKRLNLLSSIMNPALYDFYALPNWHAQLALYQFENLEKQLNHRKSIAKIYNVLLPKKILLEQVSKTMDFSSNLRFPILMNNRRSLIVHLKENAVFVSDIWYDDVAPDCPNAARDSKIILNLPTHINVSEKDANRICDLINRWIQK